MIIFVLLGIHTQQLNTHIHNIHQMKHHKKKLYQNESNDLQ